MVLKTQSSHTFTELGFNFRSKNVHDYLKEQAPELRKICQGTRKSYVWQLPIAYGKSLKFVEVTRNFGRFNSLSQTSWELMRINGEKNFDPFQKPTITINFQIGKNKKEIYLKNLFPTFPKVSGVDILQFVMSLSYACDFTLSLKDASDISASYKLLYGSGYYMYFVKGIGMNTINQKKFILKQNFYECTMYELRKLDPVARIDETLSSCRNKGISVENCPVHFLWLGSIIHYTIFPKCGLNYELANYYSQPTIDFQITPKDLTQIFNKIPQKSKGSLYPIVKNCTPKVKDFETVKNDVISLKFMKNAFEFCFPNPIFTALKLFKILKGCFTETLNFLWKNECLPKEHL